VAGGFGFSVTNATATPVSNPAERFPPISATRRSADELARVSQ
jgi:hypothetical protein